VSERWRVHPGHIVDLSDVDPSATTGGPTSREDAAAGLALLQPELSDLQNRLSAEAKRAVLVVLQGTDASGKDGTIRHVFTGLNPQAIRVAAFREPSSMELHHDFLWRVHQVVPAAGEIGIFNRSHYEDVVAVRVRGLVPRHVWEPRFDDINAFERLLVDSGTTIVKFFLHVSRAEQGRRFEERAHSAETRWKLRPEDLSDRERWSEFQAAYEDAITRTSTKWAPWYIVPADHKWFRNWVVSTVLAAVMTELNPEYPAAPT
jgi:PPK2 family polyphosphate:nucleotide phosphotransferase